MASNTSLIVSDLKLQYEGLFDDKKLYLAIKDFFKLKGYAYLEKLNHVSFTKEGKQTKIEIYPMKKYSDYYAGKIVVNIFLHDLNSVEVELHGRNLKLVKGGFRMTVDSFLTHDRKNLWQNSPIFWMFSLFMEKYFNRSFRSNFESILSEDTNDLYMYVKDFFNYYVK